MKKAWTRQRANFTPRVAANTMPDVVDECPRGEGTPLTAAPPIFNTHVENSTENEQVPPPTDTPTPPPASSSGPVLLIGTLEEQFNC